MAEHAELVSEVTLVEKMTTAERLKHAKKRRSQQLKKYAQYEKQLDKESNKRKKQQNNKNKVKKSRTARVIFVNSIVLLEAAMRNDVDEVHAILERGGDPNATNEDGLTALHQCCIDDQEDMLKTLLRSGANVNARDSELWTPLHAAATCGHVHLCKLLVEHGAELLSVNADGNMPYDICEDENTLDFIENEMAKKGVTQELIDDTRLSTEKKMWDDLKYQAANGGDLEARGRHNETYLHIAAANGYNKVAEFLVEQRVTVDIADDDAWQPVHAAACWGHLSILELLVQNGADIEAKTKSGETPFDICEDPEIRNRMLELKEEIQANKVTKTRDLRRRKSQNTRSSISSAHSAHGSPSAHYLYSSNTSLQDKVSASIRRTSMREKTPIALKEAREEAQRLRETATGDEEEEEEEKEKQANKENIAVKPEEITVTVDPDPRPAPHYASSLRAGGDSVGSGFSLASSNTSLVKSSPRPSHKEPRQSNDTHPPTPSHLSQDNITLKEKNGSQASLNRNQTPSPQPPPSRSDLSQADSNSVDLSVTDGDMPIWAPNQNAPGTLADLKKQRMQKLQDTMRLKDNVSISDEIDNHNKLPPSSNQNQPHNPRANGQPSAPTEVRSQGSRNGQTQGSPAYGGEAPKRRFTASNTEIVGGSTSNTSCCVIL